jgi:hypothetical protein
VRGGGEITIDSHGYVPMDDADDNAEDREGAEIDDNVDD